MTANYEMMLLSTPKIHDQNKYHQESLIDFSTPMSTIPNVKPNSTIIEKLFEKFHEHKTHFSQTQNYLNQLDNHLRELTNILNQFQNSFDSYSPLKLTAEQLETRLIQMSSKREQIRSIISNYQQTFESKYSYVELLNALKLSLTQKTNLIEQICQDENEFKQRRAIDDKRIHQQEDILRNLIEKLVIQQKQIHESIEHRHVHRISFDCHTKQVNEFQILYEEYQQLQQDNQQLKQKTKENINKLYASINQQSE